MSKRNVLDSLLDVLTSANPENSQTMPKTTNLSDKIPSAHSDLIITMILCNSNELFADNRKRKPIYNARRKAKWNELVENLNSELSVDYSVERVKNNYHYRITSLKRNINRMMNMLKEGEDIVDCAAFQNLSEIDKLLYEAIKSTCIENNEVVPIKRKKIKPEKHNENDNLSMVTAESPSQISNDEPIVDNINLLDNIRTEGYDELKSSIIQLVKVQTETLETMKQFMKETVSSLSRIATPATSCPTCTDNFLETFIQACNNNVNNNSSKLNLSPKKGR